MRPPLPPDSAQAPVTGPLARALERGREAFNARFALHRRMHRSLDPEAFAWVLSERLAPIMHAAFAASEPEPAREDALTAGLFDAALDLCSARLLGPSPRHDLVDAVWTELLPQMGPLLVQAPQQLAASLSNAAHALFKEHGASNQVRPGQWLEIMRSLAGLCGAPAELLRAGLTAAWRAGLAHLREQAVALCLALEPRIQRAALGLAPDGPPFTPEDLADPWALPLPRQENGMKRELCLAPPVGGFTGFGGPFAQPPEVAVSQGDLIVFDSQWCWRVFADAYGATLKRLGKDLPEDFSGPGDSQALAQDGTVRLAGQSARFPELAQAASWAAAEARNGESPVLAATLAHSHKVFLVALQPKAKRGA